MFKKFKEAYNNMQGDMLFLQCDTEPEKHKLDITDPIAYCLNDDGDTKFGINLASIYNRFIAWQNTVLNFIQQKIRNGKLSYFTDQLSQSIKIQDASKLEIVNFNLKKSFNELIYYYSQRDFTLENGNLNYEGYKNIIYNLEGLDEDIGKRILLGKNFLTMNKNSLSMDTKDSKEINHQ